MNNQPSISRAFSTVISPPTAIIRSAFGLEAALFTIVSGTLLLDTDTLLTRGFARNAAEKVLDQEIARNASVLTVEQLIKLALKSL